MLCNVFVGWEMCKAADLEGVVAELSSFSYFVVVTWGVSSLDMGTWTGKWHTAILLILHPKTSISMLHLRNVGREEPLCVLPFYESVCPGWNGPIACSCQRSAVVIESPMLFQISWQHQLHLKDHVTHVCWVSWPLVSDLFASAHRAMARPYVILLVPNVEEANIILDMYRNTCTNICISIINMEHIKWRCHETAPC